MRRAETIEGQAQGVCPSVAEQLLRVIQEWRTCLGANSLVLVFSAGSSFLEALSRGKACRAMQSQAK